MKKNDGATAQSGDAAARPDDGDCPATDQLLCETPVKTTFDGMAAVDIALAYAKHHLPVFPCRPDDKKPYVAGGFKAASTKEKVIRDWWGKWPAAMIGMPTGDPSRRDVLDIDEGVAADGRRKAGRVQALAIAAKYDGLGRPSLSVRTPNGGWQLHYIRPKDGPAVGCNKQGLEIDDVEYPDIDVRGPGGYVILPGSVRADGVAYRAVYKGDGARSAAPAWLVEAARKKEPGKRTPDEIAAAAEHTALRRMRLSTLGRACADLSRLTGGRNKATNGAAYRFGRWVPSGLLTESDIEAAILDACRKNGYLEKKGEAPVRAIIASAVGAGKAKPADVSRLRGRRDLAPVTEAPTGSRVALLTSLAGDITTTEKGAPHVSVFNVGVFFEAAPETSAIFGFDRSKGRIMLRRHVPDMPRWPSASPRPLPHELEDGHLHRLAAFMSRLMGVNVPASIVEAAIVALALSDAYSYDSMQDYLNECADKWDRTKRISSHGDPVTELWHESLPNILATYFGTENNEYTYVVGHYMMLQSVRRAHEPGCKSDYVVTFLGDQGHGKSTAVYALYGKDNIGEPITGLDKVDTFAMLRGKWVWFHDELTGYSRHDLALIKQTLTKPDDEYRLPYAKLGGNHPRRFITLATSNDLAPLRDQSGNRRFWPVWVTSDTKHAALAELRDQLWGEAVHMYRLRLPTYPAKALEDRLFRQFQDDAMTEDHWAEYVADYLLDGYLLEHGYALADVFDRDQGYTTQGAAAAPGYKKEFRPTVGDVLVHGLARGKGRDGRNEEARVTAILSRLKWERRRNGNRRFWRPSHEWFAANTEVLTRYLGASLPEIIAGCCLIAAEELRSAPALPKTVH